MRLLLVFVFLLACTPFRVDPLPDDSEPITVYVHPNVEESWPGYIDRSMLWLNRSIGCEVFQPEQWADADVHVRFGDCQGVACYRDGDIFIDQPEFSQLSVSDHSPWRSSKSFDDPIREDWRTAPFPHVRVLIHELGHAAGLDHTDSRSIMNGHVGDQRFIIEQDNLKKLRGYYCSG